MTHLETIQRFEAILDTLWESLITIKITKDEKLFFMAETMVKAFNEDFYWHNYIRAKKANWEERINDFEAEAKENFQENEIFLT